MWQFLAKNDVVSLGAPFEWSGLQDTVGRSCGSRPSRASKDLQLHSGAFKGLQGPSRAFKGLHRPSRTFQYLQNVHSSPPSPPMSVTHV